MSVMFETDRSPALLPLKSINVGKRTLEEEEKEEEEGITTPRAGDVKIPEKLPCPPAPKKKKSIPSKYRRQDMDFFIPPELETVFLRRSPP